MSDTLSQVKQTLQDIFHSCAVRGFAPPGWFRDWHWMCMDNLHRKDCPFSRQFYKQNFKSLRFDNFSRRSFQCHPHMIKVSFPFWKS